MVDLTIIMFLWRGNYKKHRFLDFLKNMKCRNLKTACRDRSRTLFRLRSVSTYVNQNSRRYLRKRVFSIPTLGGQRVFTQHPKFKLLKIYRPNFVAPR